MPLFSSPLMVVNVERKDYSNLFDSLRREQFVDCGNGCSFSTIDKYILREFPEEKNKLLSIFNSVKDEVFHYTNTDFDITTSWGTKTINGPYGSHVHPHYNCLFSAVLYEGSSTGIEFESPHHLLSSIRPNDPPEWNIYNAQTWRYIPREPSVIFFLSGMKHRVLEHKGYEPRYSLAMNLMPTGTFGTKDSTLTIK